MWLTWSTSFLRTTLCTSIWCCKYMLHKKWTQHDFIIGIVCRNFYLKSNFKITTRITLYPFFSDKFEKSLFIKFHRDCHLEMLWKNSCSENFSYILRSTSLEDSCFTNVCNFTKKRFLHWCLTLNFLNTFRTIILKRSSGYTFETLKLWIVVL